MIYKFLGNKEEFTVKDSHRYNNYFPLTNKWGSLLSAISPLLSGDIKKDNDHFITPPATLLDLKQNLLCRRDFFLKIKNAPQKPKRQTKTEIIRLSNPYPDTLQAGFFYHKLTKYTKRLDIEILNFIPYDLELEIMQVKVTNKSNKPLNINACSCLPLYGRSENTLRDHRHVSSLLNRIDLSADGILLRPTLLFNEEGHSQNHTTYFCLGKSSLGRIKGQFPTLDFFCGTGNLAKPDAIYKDKNPVRKKRSIFDGKEVLGALQFKDKELAPGGKINYIIAIGMVSGPEEKCRKKIAALFARVNSATKIKKKLIDTQKYWRNIFSKIEFSCTDKNYNGWLYWVKAQPTLRKLFGCSFLPHFDYGKGGRGWRDLWQDSLTLLHYQPKESGQLIVNSFKGIRLDGSNATIIKKDNSFLSDRNKISRVWSDHGIWPCLTLKHYIEKTSNITILNCRIPYFRDHLSMRAKKINYDFNQRDFKHRSIKNKIYYGSLLEHLLIQNLTSFFNVGKHNIIRLENADWNDALDMAEDRGETIPFSFMYAYNLKNISCLLKQLGKKQKKVELLKELLYLLDTLSEPIDYQSPQQKQKRLQKYLKSIEKLKGEKIKVEIDSLILDLDKKYKHLSLWLRKKEWLKEGFFNGYYDNKGKRTCGKHNNKIRMMLAPQVFSIMSGIATKSQIKTIWKSSNKYLKESEKSFRLNTDFGFPYQDLGRAFSFKFGDKENGAFFSHMIVMFSYGLYQAGFIREAASVINSIYKMSVSDTAENYPQLPEYFNDQGQGLYLYLTGSASWYIHTLLSQVLGIKYKKGKITAQPKLSYFYPQAKNVKIASKTGKNNFKIILSEKP